MSEEEGSAGGTSPAAAAAPPPAQPLREDQIANAVQFLIHPKVTSSPAATKRSFLERKGLTAAEIDEAFARAPEQPLTPPATVTPTAVATGQNGLISYVQPQTAVPQNQAFVPAQTAVIPVQQQQQQQQIMKNQEPVRWTQIVLGLGVVAAGVYAVHTIAVPYLTSIYNGWAASMRARQEEQERRRVEAEQAAETLRQMQVQLLAAGESMAEAARQLKEQASCGKDLQRDLLDAVRDMKQAAEAAATSAQASSRPTPSSRHNEYENKRGDLYAFHQAGLSDPMAGGNSYDDGGFFHYVNGGRDPAVASAANPYPPVRPPPGGWLGGGRDSAATTAFTSHPQGWQPPAPFSGSGTKATYSPGNEHSSAGPTTARDLGQGSSPQQQPMAVATTGAAETPPGSDAPAYPRSFNEVMEMVSKGITPPNVRTDINDTPPDPNRPPSEPRAQPARKPWEQHQARPSSGAAGSAAPWDSALASPPWAQDSTQQPPPQITSPGDSSASIPAQPLSSALNNTSSSSSEIARSPSRTGPGWGSSLPRVGPSGLASAAPPAPQTYLNKTGGASSASIYSTPVGGNDFGSPEHDSKEGHGGGGASLDGGTPGSQVVNTTVSVLQPLISGGSSWQPPSPPAPTISHLTGGGRNLPEAGGLAMDSASRNGAVIENGDGKVGGSGARVMVEAE